VPLENRAVLAEVRDDEIVVRTATQIPHLVKTAIANAMKVPENTVRVISPDVGGGFGDKAQAYPEEVACALAARALSLPLEWLEDRLEHCLASHRDRDHVHYASLRFTEEGRITALTATVRTAMGAYSVFPWTATMDTGIAMGILPG